MSRHDWKAEALGAHVSVIEEGGDILFSGPEPELKAQGYAFDSISGGGPYYYPVGEGTEKWPIRCGKCEGETFKVSHAHYETWCHCPCGNQFVIHSG